MNERNTNEDFGKSRQSPGFTIREVTERPDGSWKEGGDPDYDGHRDYPGPTGSKKIGDAPTWKTPS